MLYLFQKELSQHTKLTIVWYHFSEDSDMFDEGRRFSNFINIPFQFVERIYVQDDFVHKQTKTTPAVHLSKKNNIFNIIGNSTRKSSIYFFSQIFDWFDEYSNEPNPAMSFNFKLNNINTENKTHYLRLLKILQKISKTDKVLIRWHYEQDNNLILEIGKEFHDLLDLDFEFIEI